MVQNKGTLCPLARPSPHSHHKSREYYCNYQIFSKEKTDGAKSAPSALYCKNKTRYLYSTVIVAMFEWLLPAAVYTRRDLHSPLQVASVVLENVVVA